MFYHGNMRRGGCTTCGGGGNRNFRNVHSPSFYNNRYINNIKNNYDLGEFESSYSPYNNNNRQRIMTPPRNISNYNFEVDDNYNNMNRNNYHNYHSPQRNTGGCRSCSMGSNNVLRRNDYQRPTTGYPMRRTNNIYTFNSMNFQNNNYNYNFRKRYINDNDNDYNDIDDDTNEFNRYNSPPRNPQRNLQNSFSSENIYNNRMNANNNYSYNNNPNSFNEVKNPPRNNNNYNIRTELNNNKFRNFFRDNYNRYDDNDDDDKDNNNNNNRFNNYFREGNKNRNYYSMKNRNMNNYNNNRNNYYLNSRYGYLMTNENSKNDYYNDDRFITLNIINYQRKIGDMIQQRKSFFVYIYGSHDYTGQSWCSDCNLARPNVEDAKKIIKNKRYEKEIYFLSLPIEKIYMDDLKEDPIIQLERVPTLIYYENGIERGRLIENDLFSYQSIRDFILQAYDDYNNNNIEYNKFNMNRSRYAYQPRIYY